MSRGKYYCYFSVCNHVNFALTLRYLVFIHFFGFPVEGNGCHSTCCHISSKLDCTAAKPESDEEIR